MTRAILLSKIHALNWYGYRDTLAGERATSCWPE